MPGCARSCRIGAGVLTAIPALSLVYMTQPDNFSLYQPLVAGALWMAARGLKGHARSFALGGLLVGLATLSRNDGAARRARRSASRSSMTAGGRGGRRDRAGRQSRCGPRSPASGCSSRSWLRGGSANSRSSASSRRRRRRARSSTSARSRSGTRSRRPATLDHLLGQGHRAARSQPDRRVRRGGRDLHDAHRRRDSAARSWSSAAGRSGDPSTSARSSPTPRSSSRSRRSSPRSTFRAARSSTPRSPSRRTPTS